MGTITEELCRGSLRKQSIDAPRTRKNGEPAPHPLLPKSTATERLCGERPPSTTTSPPQYHTRRRIHYKSATLVNHFPRANPLDGTLANTALSGQFHLTGAEPPVPTGDPLTASLNEI